MNNPYSPQARAVETLSIMLELLNKKHISDLKSLNEPPQYTHEAVYALMVIVDPTFEGVAQEAGFVRPIEQVKWTGPARSGYRQGLTTYAKEFVRKREK